MTNPFSSSDTEIKDPNFKELIETKQALKTSKNESFLEKNAGLIFAVGIIAFAFLMFGAAELGLTSIAGKALALAAGSCGLLGSSGLIKKGFNYINNTNKSNNNAVKSIDEAIANVAKAIGQNAQSKAENKSVTNALDSIDEKITNGAGISQSEIDKIATIAGKLFRHDDRGGGGGRGGSRGVVSGQDGVGGGVGGGGGFRGGGRGVGVGGDDDYEFDGGVRGGGGGGGRFGGGPRGGGR